ncbi:MAG: hypothetical protein L6R40_005426 [Gallowayella cf. fulva]|nr:MAG: hypothetical protein L6R40_005426 [Xanthomendoza cf. fulva]
MATIVIVEHLVVEVVEYDYTKENARLRRIVRQTQTFKVSRDTLAASSNDFKQKIYGGSREGPPAHNFLDDDTIPAVQIWFQVLHSVEPTYDVPVEVMWHLAALGGKYGLDMRKLRVWFAAWYRKQLILRWYDTFLDSKSRAFPDPRCLLYPCWIFDHYQGFMKITHFCVYRYGGYLMDINPTRHRKLHLPPRDIQQLNAAKGRLRTIIHRDLYKPNHTLLAAHCGCKEVTLWGYEKALTSCKV